MNKLSKVLTYGVGFIIGYCIGGFVLKDTMTGAHKIESKNPEPGYVQGIELRTKDENKNRKDELVLNIQGIDYHIKETPNGYHKLVPFKTVTTVKDGETLTEIVDLPYK